MKQFVAIFMTVCLVLGLSSVSVWAADGNEWKTEMMMPTSPYYFGACVIGDSIFVLAGEKSNLVTIYNTKSDTWKMGTPMPEKPQTTKAVAIGNKIYAVCTDGAFGAFMQIYDLSTNTWTVKKDIPQFREGLGLAAIGEKLYVIDSGLKGNNYISTYDTVSETWLKSSKYSSQRGGYMAVCAGGTSIYMVGGGMNSLEVYDTNTDTWKTGAKMPTATDYSTGAMVGNKMYVMGGQISSPLNKVRIYDTDTNSWSDGISFKTPRISLESALVNGKIYVIGGYNTGRLNSVESLQVGSASDNSAAKLSALLNVSETVQLSTSYNLANNSKYAWSSTNEAVATVDSNGKVTAIAVGDADIYAQNADGTFKEYIPVKVVEAADELRLAVHLKTGEKAKLYLTDDASQVTWSSMDDSIATISADGQVTGVKKGLAIVKAELDGQTYQIYVRVNG